MLFQEKEKKKRRGYYKLIIINRDGDVAHWVRDISMKESLFHCLMKTN
jgi:hypothetical protein